MINFSDWAGLQNGSIAAIRCEMAVLTFTNGMFVMEGPSGIHGLHGDTTDHLRLAAHWAGFTADTRNKYPEIAA